MWKKVSDNVYLDSLPSAMSSSCKDMILIDCGNSIDDMNAYGFGYVNIYLYAKEKMDGVKNKDLLDDMSTMLNYCIESSNDSTYKVSRAKTYTGEYDENRKFHCNVVQLRLMII